ncbi:MAG: M23 family metallopeptidase [Candidatus Thorarchaeota archaeon]
MNRRTCVASIIVLLIVAVGVLYFLNPPNGNDNSFDNEGRYDSTILNNMGVIYSDSADIEHWNNGYSESTNCPWGAAHNGLDYMFSNDSPVIAAAPGLVEYIEVGYLENLPVYFIAVQIRFNVSVWLNYSFEGNSLDEAVRAQQVTMLDVEIGDWVAKGDQIGRFLRPVVYDHVHFSVYLNEEAACPRSVMGESDYNELMSLVHSIHPDWELCYP